MKSLVQLVAVSVVCVATTAHAQTSTPSKEPRISVKADADGYCDMVRGIADSQSALLEAPTVFGTFGLVSGADATGGSSTLPPHGRVTAGASYSVGNLVVGLALGRQATAECKRYRTESELHSFIESSLQSRSAGALAAKAAVVDAALPRAAEILQAQELAVSELRGTVDDLEVLEMRVDALRAVARQAHQDMASMVGAVAPPSMPIEELLHARDVSEREAERRSAQVRSATGWDLGLRSGYEQVLGLQSKVPVFGTVSLSVNLGLLAQSSAEKRAAAGRAAWVRQQVEGVDDRAELAEQRMQAIRTSEEGRLAESTRLLTDLDARMQAAEAMTSERAKNYARTIWFDRVMVEAEHAYLTAHIEELDRALGKKELKQ